MLNRINWNYGSKISAMQLFIKESYKYDGNGNRIQKITPYGTIDYTYNEENLLVSSGWNGNTGIIYTYDKEGNLLTQESELKIIKYAYNAQNRIMYSEVTDKKEKTHSVSYYGYDAFGRRVIEQDKDEAALRSLYDDFTFDVIKQSPTFANGLFVDSYETGIRINITGKPTGDRYRYLEDTPQQDGNRYFHLDEGNYRNVSSRYKGSRTALIVNGTIAGQNADGDISYFTTDLLGSVRNTTDGYGYVDKKYTYDAFGAIIEGDCSGRQNYGYLGKQFDKQTGLYNYGYRDYTPKVARFTTVDPIRDGENWLTYCRNDAVNHIDLWGLSVNDANSYLYHYAGNNPVKYTDPDGRADNNNSVVWTAKENLVLFGTEMRAGVSGMTMQYGYADVEFSNGTESFTKRFEVMSVYSEGLFFSIGQTTSQTDYKKTFSADATQQEIIESYEGIFATIGISGSTPFDFISFGLAKTYAISDETQDIDPDGWQGITKGVSLGLSPDCFSVNFGTQITVYHDPDNPDTEFSKKPEWFYYKPIIFE